MSAHAGDERLGPYCLREQLGEGGMGVVYLAVDEADKPVAIKVLRQGIAADETARRRLAHEVETMRRVSSPYVAEVLDADLTGNPPYIVTRYVPGKTLDDVVAEGGPLAGHRLARLAVGLTAALTAVHAAGVVHRDLKPGNVMLVGGEPVMIDFGIAQAADSTRLTMTGMFMGTPGFLAPEVIEGRPSGPAADIHSWGTTIAYAATGRPPFGSGTFEAIFYRIVHGQPDLTGMPAPLAPLVLAALARDPARRPTAADLAASAAGLNPVELIAAANGHAPVLASAAGQPPGTMQDLAFSQLRTRSAELAGMADAAAIGPVGAGAAGAAAAAAAVGAGAALGGPAQAGAIQAGAIQAGAADVAGPAAPMPLAVAPNGVAGAPHAAWPGTMPFAVRRPDNYADLLPPVNYALAGPAGAALAGPAGGATAVPPGARASAGSPAARIPLVLATIAGLIAVSVLLPIAGAAAVLIVLILLRSADVVSARRARRGVSAAAAAAYFPWAIVRSVVRFILLAPLALLCAAGAAAVGVLAAGPASLPKVAAWAAGALVACYSLGPGSAPCRRPLSRFYGRITSSSFGAVAGFAGLAAVAGVAVIAAAALTPGYWPANHIGQQLQTATLHQSFLHQWPSNLSRLGRQLMSWFGHRL